MGGLSRWRISAPSHHRTEPPRSMRLYRTGPIHASLARVAHPGDPRLAGAEADAGGTRYLPPAGEHSRVGAGDDAEPRAAAGVCSRSAEGESHPVVVRPPAQSPDRPRAQRSCLPRGARRVARRRAARQPQSRTPTARCNASSCGLSLTAPMPPIRPEANPFTGSEGGTKGGRERWDSLLPDA